jgi:hypothetical protein
MFQGTGSRHIGPRVEPGLYPWVEDPWVEDPWVEDPWVEEGGGEGNHRPF